MISCVLIPSFIQFSLTFVFLHVSYAGTPSAMPTPHSKTKRCSPPRSIALLQKGSMWRTRCLQHQHAHLHAPEFWPGGRCIHTTAYICMHIYKWTNVPHPNHRRPWGHGMLGYGSVAKRYPTTFPRVIRDAGYMTCSMGKDHFGWNATSDSGIAHGYSSTVR